MESINTSVSLLVPDVPSVADLFVTTYTRFSNVWMTEDVFPRTHPWIHGYIFSISTRFWGAGVAVSTIEPI